MGKFCFGAESGDGNVERETGLGDGRVDRGGRIGWCDGEEGRQDGVKGGRRGEAGYGDGREPR